ncbi:MAG TPA: hypothetical protein PLD88_07340, partial [Candidatus Berkiella sp.]|nr:hypothetical protein [Candidatus Berkiella sp.]
NKKLCKIYPYSSYVDDVYVKHALSWIQQTEMSKQITLTYAALPTIDKCSPYSTDDEELEQGDDLESSENPDNSSSANQTEHSTKTRSSVCKRLFLAKS